MKHYKILATCMFLLIAASSVKAQATTQPVEKARIKQGVQSGELTKHEAKTLKADQKDIRQDKQAARADGTVTAGEKAEIKQERTQASRKIYRKKHNTRTQP